MCRALLSGFLHHLENVILFMRTQVAFEMNFCISVQECPADYLDTPKVQNKRYQQIHVRLIVMKLHIP